MKRHRTPAPPEAPRRGAERRAGVNRFSAWLRNHLRVFFNTLGQLYRAPLHALLTVAVIGIALALPAALYVLLQNTQRLADHWEGTAQISLFLKPSVSDDEAEKLAARVRGLAGIKQARVLSRAQALEEFRALSGLDQALAALGENPLPALLIVTPASEEPADAEAVLETLAALPEVETAELDLGWLKRLRALLDLMRRAVWLLGALLCSAVLLIMGNTLRLAIQNRHEEIELMRLIGATDTFLRRPFLYFGLMYGLLGALFALILLGLTLGLLAAPAKTLAALYNSSFEINGLGLNASLGLLALGALLGLAGAWLAVSRQLKQIQPG
ncbi:MAG: permease-like cell division protein FtsX [Gammaproteobacteria bacterium]|nr:permease-like cell division protein FtsX [Gammaproteobacteria bacterium]